MRKSRWLSWFLNDLPDYFLIILSVILLSAGLVHFVYTFYLYEQAEARHFTIGFYWWFKRIAQVVSPLTFALWLALFCYKDRMRKKLETIEHASRMKKVVFAFWWTTILVLAPFAVEVFTTFYHNPDKSVFDLIILSLLVFFIVFAVVTSRAELRYFRKQPLCNIAAAGLLEKYTKFLNERDFDKSYNALVKACETAPDETFLWCTLASFCEFICNNATESDKYMAKAEELILTKKANSNGDKACYFNFLGGILYGRGEYEKGLEYMKQSIDIEPNPRRVKTYEEKLSEFKTKQQNTQL
ncbi:MAG: hypothetical protein WAK60_02030 [Sedimentisphaerales bacterium]